MEILSFGKPADTPPLLFIHGSYCGAWVWAKHFLPFFEQAGWHGCAISLRGHGKSPNPHLIDLYGLADYLTDITLAANRLEKKPILVGHSLGAFLAQMYALKKPVAGLALLSTPSLYGLASSAQHITLSNPALAWQLTQLLTIGPTFVDQQIIAKALFSPAMPEKEALAMLPLLQRESRRVACEAYWPQVTSRPQSPPPTLVLGGRDDAFIPVSDLERTASLWNAELKVLSDLPHGFMMDSTAWRPAAEALLEWLTVKGK